MGVKGAAYTTVIGQAVSMILTLIIFVTGNHGVKIKIRGFKFSLGTVGKIYAVGLPSSIMLSVASVLVMALNKLLITFSQTAVSLFGIYYKIQTFVYMPSSGLIQGIRPIIGYNYGAGSRKRIKECIRLSLVIVGIILVAGSLLFSLFPAQILKVFNASDDMMSIGMPALRIISSSYIFAAVGIVFSAVFEAMGKGMYSLTVSLLRQFAITVPLAYLLSLPMGLNGIWISFPIAEFFGAAASVFLYIKLINKDKIMLKNN